MSVLKIKKLAKHASSVDALADAIEMGALDNEGYSIELLVTNDGVIYPHYVHEDKVRFYRDCDANDAFYAATDGHSYEYGSTSIRKRINSNRGKINKCGFQPYEIRQNSVIIKPKKQFVFDEKDVPLWDLPDAVISELTPYEGQMAVVHLLGVLGRYYYEYNNCYKLRCYFP